ncbi:MAG: MFS transporter [Oceanospirillaceae bacterium]|nr:MFS transporter [Oceanospirillaceae bacterium]
MQAAPEQDRKDLKQWLGSARIYLHPRALTLLFLGFSAGLPLMLVFSTLSYWLREAGIDRGTITYFSWVALAYAFKWAWSPIIDRTPIPLLSRWLGRRRSWMLTAQLAIVASLIGMAGSDPTQNLELMAFFALAVAFSSATQDISIDAYRIESAEMRLQAAMAATYMLGYRLAMIIATTGALLIAAWYDPANDSYHRESWEIAYLVMAALMLVGIATTLIVPEPAPNGAAAEREQAQIEAFMEQRQHLPHALAKTLGWLYIAVWSPFADFVQRYGRPALLILALVGSYRIADVVMGIIANVFYVDMGFTKVEVAEITKLFGTLMTILGSLCGGLLVYRFGVMRMLFTGALLAAVTNLLFSALALTGHSVPFLIVTVSLDNFSAGIATAAFIAYLSSLTSISYTATQYALFSSVMLLLPKFLAGFSGDAVDLVGYPLFFAGTALLGAPVLLLVWLAARHTAVVSNGSNTTEDGADMETAQAR